MLMAMASWTAEAQVYSGYLKLDGDSYKGPDSVHVSITLPKDTYVRDTVFITNGEARAMRKAREGRLYYATPWKMALKTNLLSDVIAVPYGGVEVQIAPMMSFNLEGWYTPLNIFHPNKQTKVYGGAPEFRWWFGGAAMSKGYFVGLHANVAWYTLEWVDDEGNRVIYQNGIDELYDPGTKYPAWSAGLTYGYLLPLNRKGSWNLEFYMGIGYADYQQKRIYPVENGGSYYKHEDNSYFGITKVGIDLTYSFSLRRVKPSYAR